MVIAFYDAVERRQKKMYIFEQGLMHVVWNVLYKSNQYDRETHTRGNQKHV